MAETSTKYISMLDKWRILSPEHLYTEGRGLINFIQLLPASKAALPQEPLNQRKDIMSHLSFAR
jgi:hypothetical protein